MAAILFKSSKNIIIITLIALFVFIGGSVLLHIVPANVKDKVADGLLADFVITFPALYYFIILRPSQASVKRLLLIISLCCIIGYLVLPQHQRQYILQIRKLTVLAELIFIIYSVTKFNKIRLAYNVHQAQWADPIYNLRYAMADVIGESLAVKVIASELAVLRYGLLFWKKEKSALKGSITFSTHKEFNYIAIWCILIVAVMVEVTAFHLLLLRWSSLAANVVTALSLYGIVFFIADLTAIIKRKVLIGNEQIVLRTGLRWSVNTQLDNISAVKKISNDYQSEEEYFKGGIIKNSCNLLITFHQSVQVDKLYGASKAYNTILMHIDNYEEFAAAVTKLPRV
ncbi:hypothetical protein [Mucilaginibacter sp.]|uniref:hypothetical protein n=1 Tax=Mucilaginibacter sp. TaxID=1882438 RepID=UPI003D123207